MTPTVDPIEFIRAVKPILAKKDLPGLMCLIKTRWTPEQILKLMSSGPCDARKVAALSLSLVGCKRCLPALAEQLKHTDPMVNQMAEHAIWSIWFRGGSDEANHQLCRGAKAIDRGDYDHAIKHFNQTIQLSPEFPEAYNQRALALYLLEKYEESIVDCRRAVELMPIHFGAWAGMGHSQAHLGQFDAAVSSYRHALATNPHMCQIREAIDELTQRVKADE